MLCVTDYCSLYIFITLLDAAQFTVITCIDFKNFEVSLSLIFFKWVSMENPCIMCPQYVPPVVLHLAFGVVAQLRASSHCCDHLNHSIIFAYDFCSIQTFPFAFMPISNLRCCSNYFHQCTSFIQCKEIIPIKDSLISIF